MVKIFDACCSSFVRVNQTLVAVDASCPSSVRLVPNCVLQPKTVTLSREAENEGHEGLFWGLIPSLHRMREFRVFCG